MSDLNHFLISIESYYKKSDFLTINEETKKLEVTDLEPESLFESFNGTIKAEPTEFHEDNCLSCQDPESDSIHETKELGTFRGHIFPAWDFSHFHFDAIDNDMSLIGCAVEKYINIYGDFFSIVTLDKLKISPDFRELGLFELVLNHLQNKAGLCGSKLFLIPLPLQHLNKKRNTKKFREDYINLVKFYSSFGFQFIDESINVMFLDLDLKIEKRDVPNKNPKILPLLKHQKSKKTHRSKSNTLKTK